MIKFNVKILDDFSRTERRIARFFFEKNDSFWFRITSATSEIEIVISLGVYIVIFPFSPVAPFEAMVCVSMLPNSKNHWALSQSPFIPQYIHFESNEVNRSTMRTAAIVTRRIEVKARIIGAIRARDHNYNKIIEREHWITRHTACIYVRIEALWCAKAWAWARTWPIHTSTIWMSMSRPQRHTLFRV